MRIPHVLLVGGASIQGPKLARELEADDAFRLAEADGTQEALVQIQHERFDAILVDAPLRHGNVCYLCKRLRQSGLRVPIIVLSASHDEEDVIDALDAGAIDYLFKPIRVCELQARLRAHLRGHESSEHAVLTIGPYDFRPALRALDDPISKRHIRLTLKEAMMLKCLYRATGQSMTREALLHEVWGYKSARTHTVETHVYRLRKKIEPNPDRPSIIVNGGDGDSLGCRTIRYECGWRTN